MLLPLSLPKNKTPEMNGRHFFRKKEEVKATAECLSLFHVKHGKIYVDEQCSSVCKKSFRFQYANYSKSFSLSLTADAGKNIVYEYNIEKERKRSDGRKFPL